jgi:hypothetical protein
MTVAPAIAKRRVDSLDAFIERARARAHLWHAGEIGLHEAVDKLQHDAERTGLVDHFGQDRIQQIVADAFAPYRRAHV